MGKKLQILGAANILAASDIVQEVVATPEWGTGTGVIIQGMTGVDRDAYETSMREEDSKGRQKANFKNLRARLIAFSAVDEDGSRIFTESQVEELGNKSAKVLDRLFDTAQRLSGIGVDDVEALLGNSSKTTDDGSDSD